MFRAIMLSEAMYVVDAVLLLVVIVALVGYFTVDKPIPTLRESIIQAKKKGRWK